MDFVHIEYDIGIKPTSLFTSHLYKCIRTFGTYFRAVGCSGCDDACRSCSRISGCHYAAVFSQQLSSDPVIVRTHQKPPLPFTFKIKSVDTDNSSYTVGLVIIGTALQFVGQFLLAMQHMVADCLGLVSAPADTAAHCYCLDYSGNRHHIVTLCHNPENIVLMSVSAVMNNTLHTGRICLMFHSPLRIIDNGAISHQFDFAKFFCSQMRRCSSLSAHYGAGALELDYTELAYAARQVEVVDDSSCYTLPDWSRRPADGGLIGRVQCSGLSQQMYAVLSLGSYFNAGKGAAWAFGMYEAGVI